MSTVKWRVGQFLKDNQRTTYAFMKASGLAQMTAYNIANGKGEAVRLDTLGSVIDGLEKLTGKKIELTDLFDVVRDA